MSNRTKLFAAIFLAVLVVWGGMALYLERQIEKERSEYKKREAAVGRYEALKALWSQKAQKEAIKRLESMLRIYGIKAETKRVGGKKIYSFTVDAKRADKVLSKILNSNIAINSFSAKKVSDRELEVKIGVAP